MASRERAIVNNLNERARFYGQSDQLTIEDVRAVMAFYHYSSCQSGTKPATSVDHVIPLAQGGTNTRDNLQLLTVEENKAKGDNPTDYRAGNICPDDFTPEQPEPEPRKYRRHNYDEIKHEYLTSDLSLRELAEKHNIVPTLLYKRSTDEGWVKDKQRFGSELVATANEQAKELAVARELSVRSVLFDVIEAAVEEWKAKPRASASDLAALLKLGLVAQGEPTERTQLNVSEHADDAAILARIREAFDAGEEERTYTPLGDSGEEPSAGWSD